MTTLLSPLISEFESRELESSHTAWLRQKAAISLADSRPLVPHDAVIAEIETLLQSAEKSAANKRVA
jgi:hypothetical protein